MNDGATEIHQHAVSVFKNRFENATESIFRTMTVFTVQRPRVCYNYNFIINTCYGVIDVIGFPLHAPRIIRMCGKLCV